MNANLQSVLPHSREAGKTGGHRKWIRSR